MTDRQTLHTADKEIVGEIWTLGVAYENLIALCQVAEHRFYGSPEEQRARDFLLDLMRQYGLEQVHSERFEFDGWQRGNASLAVTSPVQQELECIPLPGSPAGVVEGELLNLGHGTLGDFACLADRIRGRIVMVTNKAPVYSRRRMHRVEKYRRAVQAGAIGFIWMREEGGFLAETGSLGWGATETVPAIGVSREVGHAMLRAGKGKPARIRFNVDSTMARLSGWNLVGDIPGRQADNRVIVAGAHYDSHLIAPGAMDNGAGIMVMLEAARALARCPEAIGTGLRFVCFTGEEMGLIGSQHYVDAHRDELDNIAFMLNLDGTGREAELGIAIQGWTDLILPIRNMVKDMHDSVAVDNYVTLYSDMYSFTAAGVPNAALLPMSQAPVRNWGHTAADTLDKVSLRDLRRDAILTARLLLRVSNAENWTVRRKSPAEVIALLTENGWREVLEIEGRWNFSD